MTKAYRRKRQDQRAMGSKCEHTRAGLHLRIALDMCPHTRHAQESAFVYFLFQASLIFVYLPKYDKGVTRTHAYLLISDAKWCGSALLARGVLAKLPPQFKSWPFF